MGNRHADRAALTSGKAWDDRSGPGGATNSVPPTLTPDVTGGSL